MIKIGKNISEFSVYSCQPKTKEELKNIIKKRIREQGPNCDLNDINTSLITDMSYLFDYSKFNGDISKWDVSNVVDMEGMFCGSTFNNDISSWNTTKVEDMYACFAYSKFNRDISKWKLRKDCYTINMFLFCPIKEEFKPKSLQK